MKAMADAAGGGVGTGGQVPAGGVPARGGRPAPGTMETVFRAHREAGRKLLVPYVTGGLSPDWVDVLHAAVAAGADGLEVGLPFSDPMIDGPTIQESSLRALAAGATPAGIVAELARASIGVPVAVMTYYNLIFRAGHRRMAQSLAEAGVSAVIVPDLPLEELDPWALEATAAGLETVLLVAPSTPDDRMAAICARTRGFVYGVGRMGVTGERAQLASTATEVAVRIRQVTDVPVCVGIGVSNPEQAATVCEVADGVIVGAALVRRLLEGGGPEGAAAFVGELRAGVDGR